MKPTLLDILGTPFLVDWCDNYHEVDDSGNADGKYIGSSCILRIRDGAQPAHEKFQTLWHEILHALEDILHVDGLDERQVDLLATGIAYVIRHNSFDVDTWDIRKE